MNDLIEKAFNLFYLRFPLTVHSIPELSLSQMVHYYDFLECKKLGDNF